jgi:hypothetical protein
MARVLKFFAITQDGKTADADIHNDGGAAYRQRLRFRHFTNKKRIPAINNFKGVLLNHSQMGFHLWRLANACTGLWRELFTRACFPVGQGCKQGD